MNREPSKYQEIDLARERPHQFLGPLLQHHRSSLQRIARRRMTARLRSQMDTSDVVQQTMVEAWSSWPTFLGSSRGQLMNWLQTLLRRVVYRANEREYRHPVVKRLDTAMARAVRDAASETATGVELEEQRQRICSALDRLSSVQRQVIVLRHFHGLRFTEIAAVTSRTASAARMAYARGIVQLRASLSSEFGERDNSSGP